MFKSLLIPFDFDCQSDQSLIPILNAAEALFSEIILLRVNLPVSPKTQLVDMEQLYTELKALQIQVQAYTVPIRVEIMPGLWDEAITRYTTGHDIEMIMFPERFPLSENNDRKAVTKVMPIGHTKSASNSTLL